MLKYQLRDYLLLKQVNIDIKVTSPRRHSANIPDTTLGKPIVVKSVQISKIIWKQALHQLNKKKRNGF